SGPFRTVSATGRSGGRIPAVERIFVRQPEKNRRVPSDPRKVGDAPLYRTFNSRSSGFLQHDWDAPRKPPLRRCDRRYPRSTTQRSTMSATKIGDGLLVWGADGIEPGTIEQAAKSSRLPFVHARVALMPDAHVGIGATVGSVIATQGAIV